MKKRIAILFAALALSAAPAFAKGPEKLWEAIGFANPESVLWDEARNTLYVSNVNGAANEKAGNGYISKLSPDGKVTADKWVTGLDAPKGMAVVKGRLYVSDIDRLAVVDIASGKITKTYAAKDAKFLNDVAADAEGTIYVSDMLDNAIWRLKSGNFEKWLADSQLESPNGLKVDNGRLMVAAFGPMNGDGFATSAPGRLKAVSIADKIIRDASEPFGNLDGLEPDGQGGWLVSDWVNGVLFRVSAKGRPTRLLSLDKGSADIGFMQGAKTVLVPMMLHGKVVAWRLP